MTPEELISAFNLETPSAIATPESRRYKTFACPICGHARRIWWRAYKRGA